MKTLPLGRIRGIDIRLHPTFALLPIFFAWMYGRAYGAPTGLRAAFLVLGVFACVLFHELCHSLVALHYRIRVPSIVLYPFGGVATLEHIPRDPAREFWIAAAGPASNFLLAAVLYGPFLLWVGPEGLASPGLDSWRGTLVNVYWINPLLGLFNLIPAFPMDGGRILRAFLASRMDYLRATRISALCGRVFAILFFLAAALQRNGFLALIGAYVFVSAGSEVRQVRQQQARSEAAREDRPT